MAKICVLQREYVSLCIKNLKTMNKEGQTTAKKRITKQVEKKVSARDRIKPRGLCGWMEGKIHYDENADIFNLSL